MPSPIFALLQKPSWWWILFQLTGCSLEDVNISEFELLSFYNIFRYIYSVLSGSSTSDDDWSRMTSCGLRLYHSHILQIAEAANKYIVLHCICCLATFLYSACWEELLMIWSTDMLVCVSGDWNGFVTVGANMSVWKCWCRNRKRCFFILFLLTCLHLDLVWFHKHSKWMY